MFHHRSKGQEGIMQLPVLQGHSQDFPVIQVCPVPEYTVQRSEVWLFQGWATGQPENITSSPSPNTNPDLHASATNMYSLCNLFILYTDRLRISETSFQTGRREGRKKETSKWMKEQRKEGIVHNAKCLKSMNSLRVSSLLPLAS